MSGINDKNFEKIIERVLKNFGIDFKRVFEYNQDSAVKSWYYGYSISMGPDGKPVIREFGNTINNITPKIDGFPQNLQKTEFREPLVQVDINKNENKVRILVEMPGVTKDSIKINASESLVRIKAEYESRKYETDVPIEAKINPATANATYNNGILDLSFEIIETSEDSGFKVKVK
jgi:HSP20 family protein